MKQSDNHIRNNLKVVFLSVFPPLRGGISRFSIYLQNHLSNYTDFVSYNYKKLYPDILFPGTSQFDQTSESRKIEQLAHTFHPLNWKHSAKTIDQEKPDVFIFSHWHPFVAPSTISILKNLKQKNPQLITSGIFHNVVPHESFPFREYLTRRLIHFTDLPVVLSSQTENEFKETYPEKSPVRLFHPVYSRPLPTGSRQEIRQKYGISKNQLLFLFFGLIRDYKGLDLLFKALHNLSPEALRMRIIVAGEFYTKAEPVLSLIPENWRDRIIIENRFIPDEEADEILHASDVMLLPYRSASQSGILADAVNFGLPVICTDQPGFLDIITQDKHGMIVPSENVTALSNAITEMASTANLSKMRENVIQLQEELSWDRFSSALYHSIKKTVKKIHGTVDNTGFKH